MLLDVTRQEEIRRFPNVEAMLEFANELDDVISPEGNTINDVGGGLSEEDEGYADLDGRNGVHEFAIASASGCKRMLSSEENGGESSNGAQLMEAILEESSVTANTDKEEDNLVSGTGELAVCKIVCYPFVQHF